MPRTTATQRQQTRDSGTCLNFDGSNDFITVTGSSSINVSTFTYTVWIKVIGTGNRAIIGGDKPSGSRCPEFRVESTNKLELLEQSVASIATSTGTIPLGVWTFVSVTYSASGAWTFYINGVASGTGTNLRTFGFSNLLIGKQLLTENFKGKMDDVRIYGRVLTATEISGLYYGIEPSSSNLGGWWKFDEGSGTSATDSTGNGNTGTITTATYSTDVFMKPRSIAGTRRRTADHGYSLEFDGSSSEVLVTSDSMNLSVFTYVAWVRPRGSGQRALKGGSKASGARDPEFRVNSSNQLELLEQGVASIGTSTGALTNNVWSHVAVTYSGSGAYVFYINGVASGSGTSLRTFGFGDMYIGRQLTAEYFNGHIDDFRVYSSVLTSTEIASLFNRTGASSGSLVGRYKFDEGAGTTALDSSGNANNGTITTANYSTEVPGKHRSMYLRDVFVDANGAPISAHVPTMAVGSWTQTASTSFYIQSNKLTPNRYTDNDKAIMDVGVSDFTLIGNVTPFSDGTNAGIPGLMFRYTDTNNYWYIQVDAKLGEVDVYRVQSGSHTKEMLYSATIPSGTPVNLRVDCFGPNITFFVNGVEVSTYISSFNQTATIVGIRLGVNTSPATKPTWNDIEVKPFIGTVFNWPVFSTPDVNPILSLGANGTYDDADLNDPNVAWDAANHRYVLYYSAYSGTGCQTTAVAFSNSLTTGYTKSTSNPVFNAAVTGFGEDGGLAYFKGLWYHSYSMNSDVNLGMATSSDLINWTDRGVVLSSGGGGWDTGGIAGSFLRVTEDGSTLQLWYAGGDGAGGGGNRAVGFASATDGLTFTKSSANPIIREPSTYGRTDDFGSVSVFVPPGKEGKEYLVSVDCNVLSTTVRRVTSQFISVDGMATWHQRYKVLAGTTGWVSKQTIDPFILLDNGTMYLFYCGTDTDGGTVNLNGQIGVVTASWPYTSLAALSG